MKRYIKNEKEIKVGEHVNTPLFHGIEIEEIFNNEQEARDNGYVIPTNYFKHGYGVLGKQMGTYIKFAAYIDEGQDK